MNNRRSLITLILSGALALGTAGPALAKHGDDDPAGHDRGDDHGQVHHGKHHRHGHDDGPNHT